eukprot:m.116778 g.116778  ORF g.116778 m.116778 type:complete len:64 (+) comp37591_c0_seq1:1969-2160(+)
MHLIVNNSLVHQVTCNNFYWSFVQNAVSNVFNNASFLIVSQLTCESKVFNFCKQCFRTRTDLY